MNAIAYMDNARLAAPSPVEAWSEAGFGPGKRYGSFGRMMRALRGKIARQMDEISKMSRLKRYIATQIAEAILKGEVGLGVDCAARGNSALWGGLYYRAVGHVTSLAPRLCDEAKGCQILTNQKTLGAIERRVEAEPIGELNLKGFARSVSAFNITRLRK